MTKDEALKLALDFIERVNKDGWILADFEPEMYVAITAIKEALAQSEQEPVAWMDDYNACKCSDNETRCFSDRVFRMMQKYTAPPQRTWVGLTDDEIEHVRNDQPWWAIRAIEDLLGELRVANIKLSMRPQRTWVGLEWLPEHKCGLHLSHNEHLDVYETVEEFYDPGDFVSEAEWLKAIKEDGVWVLHWYPNTPIGFTRIAASTLDALESALREKNNVHI